MCHIQDVFVRNEQHYMMAFNKMWGVEEKNKGIWYTRSPTGSYCFHRYFMSCLQLFLMVLFSPLHTHGFTFLLSWSRCIRVNCISWLVSVGSFMLYSHWLIDQRFGKRLASLIFRCILSPQHHNLLLMLYDFNIIDLDVFIYNLCTF